jgi:molecular chaperone IbpA
MTSIEKFANSVIGFDRMIDRLLASTENDITVGSYPPYNLIQDDEDHFRLELALAGFKGKDITVSLADGVVTVEGHRTIDVENGESKKYRHRGIAARSFKRSWTLAESVHPGSVTYEDGIMTIQLTRIVPESKKPKVLWGD